MPRRLLHSFVMPNHSILAARVVIYPAVSSGSMATCILQVMKIDADWDPFKAASNEQKHDGVRFTDAATVLADPLALTVFDHLHSDNEERWFTLGRTSDGTLLAVSHTVIDTRDETTNEPLMRLRIISARRATRRERVQYEANGH